ncbi:MAG: nucleotidyl transferase AbiEii/AbiGii toxin family protein [Candidatus Ancillula sp.]|nr:nucleotidyl transferase AbiEii/AbiGii toxin family protein [Candidatus Ancillula sp.]
MSQDNWQEKHGEVIKAFLVFLNQRSDGFVLKGGTSLSQCYGLNRFSEDIDLDIKHGKIENHVKTFCEQMGYSYRLSKNSSFTERCFIDYGNDQHPLKVEASSRRKEIPGSEIEVINGINVYSINRIAIGKIGAYNQRDKIRDLFDISFIVNNYLDSLSSDTQDMLVDAFQYKGLDQFDYLTHNNDDPLIDSNKLAESLLLAYEKLGLLYTEEEKEEM